MDLLTNIEAFIATHGMKDSQFGILALNDKNLMAQLRGEGGKRQRRLWPETEAKVKHFMATYRPESAAA